MPNVVLVAGPRLAGPLRSGLTSVNVSVTHLEPDDADRLGAAVGASLILFASPPGRCPSPEMEAHAAGIPALHAWWDRAGGHVGPLVADGIGPCPSCLATQSAPMGHQGTRPLAAWVAATVALEVHAALRRRVTDLVASTLSWVVSDTGLAARRWDRRPD